MLPSVLSISVHRNHVCLTDHKLTIILHAFSHNQSIQKLVGSFLKICPRFYPFSLSAWPFLWPTSPSPPPLIIRPCLCSPPCLCTLLASPHFILSIEFRVSRTSSQIVSHSSAQNSPKGSNPTTSKNRRSQDLLLLFPSFIWFQP